MLNDKLSIMGRLKIELRDELGNLKDSREIKNLVVNDGRAFIAQSMCRAPSIPTAMSHIAVGTSIMAVTNYISTGTTTVTATVGSTAQLSVGDTIIIEGATGAEQIKLNGTWTIATIPNSTTFTFVVSVAPASATYSTTLGTLQFGAGLKNTSLMTEIGTRSGLTATNQTQTVTNDTAQFVASFAAGNGTGAITEAGVFNNSTGGTMLCRTRFPVINKGANDTLTITWRVTVSSS